nr:MAG TPA: hypothetical protein [Bacteriophage sp.]
MDFFYHFRLYSLNRKLLMWCGFEPHMKFR